MDDPYKKSLLERECVKCAFPDGIIIRPDGVHALDPCVYETIEIHRNVTVEILRCKNCGNTEIIWFCQKNTEDEFVCDENK